MAGGCSRRLCSPAAARMVSVRANDVGGPHARLLRTVDRKERLFVELGHPL